MVTALNINVQGLGAGLGVNVKRRILYLYGSHCMMQILTDTSPSLEITGPIVPSSPAELSRIIHFIRGTGS